MKSFPYCVEYACHKVEQYNCYDIWMTFAGTSCLFVSLATIGHCGERILTTLPCDRAEYSSERLGKEMACRFKVRLSYEWLVFTASLNKAATLTH